MGNNQKLAHFMFIVEGPLSFWQRVVDDRVEQVGGLEQADVVAWDCGLCQGHLPAAAAVVVVAVAGTTVGRVGTAVVVVAVDVVVAAAAVASAVAAVASDPVDLSMSGLVSSFLPNQFGSAHEGHILCPGIGNNPTHCGLDGDDRHNTLFDPPPYSNLPSQEGV
ncbi:hypothetical protein Taro_046584 [Colocasia esculenta]|uniref:Uncharacterized protein n=1 Tax=Colocasia esculenta TaxID=4460 RepID=A0A843X2K5_COLES|nr:hypothetical protein [Colocasia esculenta]